jgi:hypothetical protein
MFVPDLVAGLSRDAFKGHFNVAELTANSARGAAVDAVCDAGRLTRFRHVHGVSVVQDVLRATKQLDAAAFGALHAFKDIAGGKVIQLALMDARSLNAAMPLSGALRAAAALRPQIAFETVAEALLKVQARPLGLASFAVARVDRSLSSAAAQTLAALAVHELDGDEAPTEDPNTSALILKLFELERAVNALPERAIVAFRALSVPRSGSRWLTGASTVSNFVATLAGVISAVLSYQTLLDARLAREAELRSEHARAEEVERVQHEYMAAVARIEQRLGELIELQRDKANDEASDRAHERACAYVVDHKVFLRASRSGDAERLVALYPGDVVELVEQGRDRIRVRSCDYVREQAVTGWAPKKYFKRL